MNWPLITRARHQRELDAQKCGYDRLFAQIDGKHASLQQRITDLEAGAVSETEAGAAWQERRETKLRYDK